MKLCNSRIICTTRQVRGFSLYYTRICCILSCSEFKNNWSPQKQTGKCVKIKLVETLQNKSLVLLQLIFFQMDFSDHSWVLEKNFLNRLQKTSRDKCYKSENKSEFHIFIKQTHAVYNHFTNKLHQINTFTAAGTDFNSFFSLVISDFSVNVSNTTSSKSIL